MAWTTPKTWTALANLTAAELNEQLRDNSTWLKAALTTTGITSDSALSKLKGALVGAQAVRQASQSITAATSTSVDFNETDTYDSDSFHDTVTNNERITIPAGMGGYYYVSGKVHWATATVNGTRLIWVEKNGKDGTGTELDWLGSSQNVDSTDDIGPRLLVAGPVLLAAGDFICLTAYCFGQNSSVTNSFLSAVRIFAT